MIRRYDIVALDVDGTLLTEKHVLTADTRDAVRQAAEAGAEIVLCTGRGPSNTFPVLEDLGLSGVIITHNGAATVDAAKRELLHHYPMEAASLEPYITYCREHGVHYDVNTAFELYIESATPEVEAMYANYRITPVKRGGAERLPEGLVKLTVFGEQDVMDKVQADWEAWPPGLQRIRSGDYFIDVQHAEASKGRALEQLAKLRGADRSRVLAIGNYYNDVGMLEYAGLGIAMNNSPDDVKSAADAVTMSNDEDGVAAALQKYLYL
jgi:Cof subfamily protein (haloacid dehalogenase superfamily)